MASVESTREPTVPVISDTVKQLEDEQLQSSQAAQSLQGNLQDTLSTFAVILDQARTYKQSALSSAQTITSLNAELDLIKGNLAKMKQQNDHLTSQLETETTAKALLEKRVLELEQQVTAQTATLGNVDQLNVQIEQLKTQLSLAQSDAETQRVAANNATGNLTMAQNKFDAENSSLLARLRRLQNERQLTRDAIMKSLSLVEQLKLKVDAAKRDMLASASTV